MQRLRIKWLYIAPLFLELPPISSCLKYISLFVISLVVIFFHLCRILSLLKQTCQQPLTHNRYSEPEQNQRQQPTCMLFRRGDQPHHSKLTQSGDWETCATNTADKHEPTSSRGVFSNRENFSALKTKDLRLCVCVLWVYTLCVNTFPRWSALLLNLFQSKVTAQVTQALENTESWD